MKVYNIDAPTPQGSATQEQQAFMMALEFHEAAHRCGEMVKDSMGAPITALCPMIVSYAFAAELYLKSLAGFGGGLGKAKGHRLDNLFGRLSAQVQDDIADSYLARTGRPRVALKHDLGQFAKAFEEWRYVYEADGRQIHLNLLIAFSLVTYQTIRRLRPEWEVRAYQDERIEASRDHPSLTVANFGGGIIVHAVDGTGTLNLPEA